MKKLILIDGHSIIHRTFYGIPDLTNSEGIHTNAIYGFVNILLKLIDEEAPDAIAVAFDMHAPTFRHEKYPEYKGTRKPMPEELREQVPLMKELLIAMDIPIMEKEGFEADDLLGTAAKKAEKEGYEVSLVSGDRDLLQIASDKIKIRIPKTKPGRTEIEDYNTKDVIEKYKVDPAQFIELKALMGDTSDNVPGVPKIGEKTATDLMVRFGSIENIYASLDQIEKKSVRETLAANRELLDLSLFLVTINTDAPLPFEISDLKAPDIFTDKAYEMCQRLNFKNILSRFSEGNKKAPAVEYEIINDFSKADLLFNEMASEKSVALSAFKQDKEIYALSFTDSKKTYYIKAEGFMTSAYLKDKINALIKSFSGTDKKIALFDLKDHFDIIENKDVTVFNDVKLMAYLLNPEHKEYESEDIANEFAGMMTEPYKNIFGKMPVSEAVNTDEKKCADHLCALSSAYFAASQKLSEELKKADEYSLYTDIELPLCLVLYEMEERGVSVKKEALAEYSSMLGEKIDECEKKIYKEVGEEFNINSPKQLGEILFEKMGIKGGKKTKTGYSTAADVLDKLAVDYPVVKDILTYRMLTKLKSTYADGLSDFIGDDGKIHTTFNQMITATGRISSTEPNLQNIPMRTEMGRQIRGIFVADEGNVFIDADYSQVELRVLAHICGDKGLIEAFNSGEDFHTQTAARVFNVSPSEVTPDIRRKAKAVNFGVVYGISAFGLAKDIDSSRQEAAEFIEQYFLTYPKVKQFQEETVKNAKETGYTVTMFKRRRIIPELKSSNFMQRQFGERAAMNAPIQGTAADIIKIAMLKADKALKDEGLKARLILQVHDELLIEAPKDEEEKVKEILKREMENAVSLSVPLEVEVGSGTNWLEAH